MTIGRRDFHARQNEKVIYWLAVQPHQTFLQQISDRVARVVIGDRDTVQALGARGGN